MEWLQGEAYKKTKNKSAKVRVRILEPVPEWIDDLDSPKKWVKMSVTTTQGPPVGPAIDPEDVGNIASVWNVMWWETVFMVVAFKILGKLVVEWNQIV